MAREPVESSVRAEALQSIAMPKLQGVQARFDPRADKAYQLAEQLGAARPYIDQMKQGAAIEEKKDALSYANSMTADDLRKKIDNGELPAWKSPIWVATVQNTAGDNAARGIFREAESRIANGEFKTQQELEQFIQSRRDDTLAGKSSYEIHGFDTNYNELKNRAFSQMNSVMTKRYETEGVTVANEAISNRTAEVTSPEWNGRTNQERAQHILAEYEKHRSSRIINDDTARGVLDTTILKLATSGNKDLVEELLKTKLPNNGPTIETFLDVRNGQSTGRSLTLRNTAETHWNRAQNEAALRVIEAENEVVLKAAQDNADELVAQGRGSLVGDVVLRTATGTKTIPGKDIVEVSIQKQLAANPDMGLDGQTILYKRSGIINEAWKKELQTATFNLGEVTLDAQNKPVGKLLQPTLEALDKFAIIDKTDAEYAKKLVGEEAYKTLHKVDALRFYLNDPHQAAGVVTQINRKQYNPQTWGNTQKQINSAMADLQDASLFSWDFGDAKKNILPIADNLKELSESLVQARIAPDGKTAVKMALEYMQKNTVRINDTLYMRADMPRVVDANGMLRDKEDPADWFKNYQKESLLPRLRKMGIEPNFSDLTLAPEKGSTPSYRVQLRNQPIPAEDGKGFMIITRQEVEKWIGQELEVRDQLGAEKYQQQRTMRDNAKGPTVTETPGGAAMVYGVGRRRTTNAKTE